MTAELRRLASAVSFHPLRLASSFQGGRRRARMHGLSLEFADLRSYTPGDDLRRVDWNAFARSGDLFVKLTHDEQILFTRLIVDTSASMGFRQGRALEAALFLGCVALGAGDALELVTLGQGQVRSLGRFRGAGSIDNFENQLRGLTFAGAAGLDKGFARVPALPGSPGLTLVLSDFLEEGGGCGGLRTLGSRPGDLAAVQVLAEDEIEPEPGGEVELEDVESGQRVELRLDAASIGDYLRSLADLRLRLAAAMNGEGRHLLMPGRGPVYRGLTAEGARLGLIR